MCDSCHGDPAPTGPTRSDMTVADGELFAHDAAKPRHDPSTCKVAACWLCFVALPLADQMRISDAQRSALRLCATCGTEPAVEGAQCIRCREIQARGEEWVA